MEYDDMSVGTSATSVSTTTRSSTATASSVQLPPIEKSIEEMDLTETDKIPYDIDFIGTGSTQVSQFNIFQRRSLEPIKSSDAQLSARGKFHRSIDLFRREAQNTSAIIANTTRKGKRLGLSKPPANLLLPYFQRALAMERLNHIDKAISDYSACILIDPMYSQAYFNRAGLHTMQGNKEAALVDLDKAIELDPANMAYRTNKALILRSKGSFMDAIGETMVCRAVELNPSLKKDLKDGKDLHLDSSDLIAAKMEDDPILAAMRVPKEQREQTVNMGAVVDFLKILKFFAPFRHDGEMLSKIALKLDLHEYKRGDVIFEEKQPGSHFYMILDGEVSIVKLIKDECGEVAETITLVKLFRGQSFGDTALESKGGLRTAGAIASNKTYLLALYADDYQLVTTQYKSHLRAEVRHVLSQCEIFRTWDESRVDYLSSFAEVKMFNANSTILTAGQPVKSLYIVKKGVLKLHKVINKPSVAGATKMTTKEGKATMESPGLWVMETNWRNRLDVGEMQMLAKGDKVSFTVGVLCSGQVFGELAVLDPDIKSPVTATSFTTVELYVFDSDVLISLGARFNVNTITSLTESLNLHNPAEDKLAYYFRSKYMWEKRKEELLESDAAVSAKLKRGASLTGGGKQYHV